MSNEQQSNRVESMGLLDDLKSRRGWGSAYDQLVNERKISDLLEKATTR